MKRRTNPNASKQTRGLIYEPKLDWEKVNYIREWFKEYDPVYGCKGMGKKFGVSANTISKIVNGDIWKPRRFENDIHPPMTSKRYWKNWADYHRKMERLKAEVGAIRTELNEQDIATLL